MYSSIEGIGLGSQRGHLQLRGKNVPSNVGYDVDTRISPSAPKRNSIVWGLVRRSIFALGARSRNPGNPGIAISSSLDRSCQAQALLNVWVWTAGSAVNVS